MGDSNNASLTSHAEALEKLCRSCRVYVETSLLVIERVLSHALIN